MGNRSKNYAPNHSSDRQYTPFDNAEEAWFWFINAREAKDQGARISSGQNMKPRPCEPSDIWSIVNRLHTAGRLKMDHILVLRHFGVRRMPPDARRVKEVRAAELWKEALDIIAEELKRKRLMA